MVTVIYTYYWRGSPFGGELVHKPRNVIWPHFKCNASPALNTIYSLLSAPNEHPLHLEHTALASHDDHLYIPLVFVIYAFPFAYRRISN